MRIVMYCSRNEFKSYIFTFLIALIGIPSFFQNMLWGQQFTKVTAGSVANDIAASRSVNWIDYDGDGDLDLFVSRGRAGGQNNIMYKNNGAPTYTFTKMDTMIISRDNEPSDGSTWGDIDNDGDADLFVVNWYNKNNMLYINNGKDNFTRILTDPTTTSGGYSETAVWGDYNNDGLLDLYVSNSSGSLKNFLYKNVGNNQFQKALNGAIANDTRHTRGVSWIDYDDDGDLDMYAANEEHEDEKLYRNMLIETGIDTFIAIDTGAIVNDGRSTWSASWGDYDNDRDEDLFNTNFTFETNSLFVNHGNGFFVKDTTVAMSAEPDYSSTGHWVDYDNDGDLDVMFTSAYSGGASRVSLYKNNLMETDTATFQKIPTTSFINDLGYWYGMSWGDYDNDGDLDVYVAGTFGENAQNLFYRNNGNSNSWVTFDCHGRSSNWSGIGAKVYVKAVINGKQVWQMRTVEGQSGYCGQNLQLHFGLGNATVIESLKIKWPSGIQEVFTNVAVNKKYMVSENDATPVALNSPAHEITNNDPAITLRWNKAIYGAPYVLQVSTDSTFSGSFVVSDSTITDTAKNILITHNNSTYYWRVRSARSIYTNVWSSVRSIFNQVPPPQPPAHVSPSEGALHQPISIKLRWRSVSYRTAYRAQLSTDSLFAMLTVNDSMLTDTSKQLTDLLNDTKYYWRISASNIGGEGSFSQFGTFTTIVDTPDVPVLTLPADGATELPASPQLTWSSANLATSYRLEVSTDSTFVTSTNVYNDSLTDKTLSGLQHYKKYYWRVRSSNIGGTSAFSPVRSFSTILATASLVSPVNGDPHQQQSISVTWNTVASAESYRLAVSTDSAFASVFLDETGIADTSYTVSSLAMDSTYYWRVQAMNTASTSEWSQVWKFTVNVTTVLYSINERWNLISVPMNFPNFAPSAVFPSAISNAFSFSSLAGYAQASTLEKMKGYWLKFPSDSVLALTGYAIQETSVTVTEGWNIVAPGSQAIAVTDIASHPSGIVTSAFYGYNNGYVQADTLYPSKGYWVKANESATLIFSGTGLLANTIKIADNGDIPPSPPFDLSSDESAPARYALIQNYPNPFNPQTVIQYHLAEDAYVQLQVFNMLGEEVARLIDGIQTAGIKSVLWEAVDMPSGVYAYRLTAGTFSETRKMLLIR